MSLEPMAQCQVDKLLVEVYPHRQAMGQAAAHAVISHLQTLLVKEPVAHVVFAAAPSQNEFLAALVAAQGVDWSRVIAFHLDEYVGLAADAPQRFSTFLRERIFSRLPFREVHILDGNSDPNAECSRYAALLAKHPLHIACIGIGENGHLAFNDPPVANFNDPVAVKVVQLEQRCREQQVHDGCFPTVDAVPTHALTLTISTIMAAQAVFCMVPGPTKKEAVRETLQKPISTACPASILRTHNKTCLYLDNASAELIL